MRLLCQTNAHTKTRASLLHRCTQSSHRHTLLYYKWWWKHRIEIKWYIENESTYTKIIWNSCVYNPHNGELCIRCENCGAVRGTLTHVKLICAWKRQKNNESGKLYPFNIVPIWWEYNVHVHEARAAHSVCVASFFPIIFIRLFLLFHFLSLHTQFSVSAMWARQHQRHTNNRDSCTQSIRHIHYLFASFALAWAAFFAYRMNTLPIIKWSCVRFCPYYREMKRISATFSHYTGDAFFSAHSFVFRYLFFLVLFPFCLSLLLSRSHAPLHPRTLAHTRFSVIDMVRWWLR